MISLSNTGKDFMEKTRYRYLGYSDQSKGFLQPPLEEPYDDSKPTISLTDPSGLEIHVNFTKLIGNRRSIRTYSEKPLSKDELSYLLWCTQGVKDTVPRNATLRTVPSAGSRHAFETYLLLNRVEELSPGLYRYLALDHKLLQIDLSKKLSGKIVEACLRQGMVSRSAITFIWSALAYRMTWRYQERGYRYLHMDAGHVCQNLYLAAEAIGCGSCAIGAFDDDMINNLLGFDGVKQFVIYIATVGKRS
jgi:SagB-type dehydrogenase family enzyme